jgi:hypothetical protein
LQARSNISTSDYSEAAAGIIFLLSVGGTKEERPGRVLVLGMSAKPWLNGQSKAGKAEQRGCLLPS